MRYFIFIQMQENELTSSEFDIDEFVNQRYEQAELNNYIEVSNAVKLKILNNNNLILLFYKRN